MPRSSLATEALQQLHPTTWKSSLEILDGIRKLRQQEDRVPVFERILGKVSKKWAYLFMGPSIAQLHDALKELEAETISESRQRDDSPKVRAARGGFATIEWRLTAHGIMERALPLTTTNAGNAIPVHPHTISQEDRANS